MKKNREKIGILIRLDEELLKLVEDVHHDLRFKSREAAMRAMLEAGGRSLIETQERAQLEFLKESAVRTKQAQARLSKLLATTDREIQTGPRRKKTRR